MRDMVSQCIQMVCDSVFDFHIGTCVCVFVLQTAGWPCCLMSIWAKEQVSPTPTTSTVKFRKKSMISRDFLLSEKMRMKGVTRGLISSSRMKTCTHTHTHTHTHTNKGGSWSRLTRMVQVHKVVKKTQ